MGTSQDTGVRLAQYEAPSVEEFGQIHEVADRRKADPARAGLETIGFGEDVTR